jgi:hypothetical protein
MFYGAVRSPLLNMFRSALPSRRELSVKDKGAIGLQRDIK